MRTIYHRVVTCNVLIGLSEDKTPIAIGFTRSQSQAQVSHLKNNVNMGFAHDLKQIYHKAFIFHMLIGRGENKSPGFSILKVKVT